jgi:hypothetical protein
MHKPRETDTSSMHLWSSLNIAEHHFLYTHTHTRHETDTYKHALVQLTEVVNIAKHHFLQVADSIDSMRMNVESIHDDWFDSMVLLYTSKLPEYLPTI